MSGADLNFYFDPVCPFAWMTSKWVRLVAAKREMSVDWRFISLRLINAHIDYDAHFPAEYERGHTAGLRLLRVAARTRAEFGPPAVGILYAGLGRHIFDSKPVSHDAGGDVDVRATAEFVAPILRDAGLPVPLAQALDDAAFDDEIRAEGEEALSLTGRDVGTPILHFQPPKGAAFFGPVISRLPSDDDAVALWDHVTSLAAFPGFAELKRSLREVPQLRGLGVSVEEVGAVEDWHGGSRRPKR